MPIYEYKCEDCGKVSEILVKNRARESEVLCPECQAGNLKKLISIPGAVMTKGKGTELPPMPACGNAGPGGCKNAACPAFQN